ncbi:MAG: sensor histidine kinase, partial [Pseudomonadota bacterium]|nr:sensor histidine kinase [Pseudomonadota bacterium]
LATNSLKYGALSVPDGKVTVSWTVDPDQERQRLRLVWTELGGPAVRPPARKGFGSRIIEKVLAADFTGKVDLDYDPQGVRCSLDGFVPARSSTPR